jgi:nucleotide-binding universal stress UspA family protein
MYQNLLIPVDGSPTSNLGLFEGIKLARLTGGRIRLLHVVDQLSFAMGMDAYSTTRTGDWLGMVREEGATVLQAARNFAAAEGAEVETVLADTFNSPVHEVVAAEARKWPTDLIVLGTHGRRGAKRLFLGSDAELIVRYAPVPVLLVRPADAAPAAVPESVQISVPAAALSIE